MGTADDSVERNEAPTSEMNGTKERDVDTKTEICKKRTVKTKMKNLLNEPSHLIAGIVVCVMLPFGIYACDVILSVNVLDFQAYKDVVIARRNNFSEIPTPYQLTGQKYHVLQSILHTVQFNAQNAQDGNAKIRISRDVVDQTQPSIADIAVETTETPESTMSSTAAFTSKTATVKTNASASSMNETATTPSTRGTDSRSHLKPPRFIPARTLTDLRPIPKRAILERVNSSWYQQQDGEFCFGLYYFYELHITYYNKTRRDWFNDMSETVYKKEQTMFFMFTIIGFITLLIGLGLRCDVFLSNEWSSFILINLIFYSISMALTVAIFADESGSGDLRCATCRFTSYCSDIDPWDYTTHWPALPDNVQWFMVALISFVLKLLDCFVIGIVTLKFIIDFTQSWWITCLKVFGWIFVFPMLIFTPMLGVARYVAFPRVMLEDLVLTSVVEVFFYIGAILWVITLIVLPFFCKMRMCSGSEEEERNEEEAMYE